MRLYLSIEQETDIQPEHAQKQLLFIITSVLLTQ
ncbi:hypothetical protein HNP81_000873 [Peribacillus huizhouensis]|uniref:Uncharacterized protein n=1 Tax=Peribacillus huizhouensis TaxID=1501239 RepID=A0ABR6CM00_9BACI|nr:hypothetical protein [Peribacillus huizhouensis]